MRTSRTDEYPKEIKWGPMAILSVSFHVAIFLMVFFVPESFSTRRPLGGIVYEVDLVEVPGGRPDQSRTTAPSKGEAKAAIPKDAKAKRIEENLKKEEKPLVIAKKTSEKEVPPAKKPEVSPSELIDKAISKIEKKVKSEEHLDQALSKLEQRTTEKEEVRGEGPGGVGKSSGGILGTAMQIYMMEVENLIRSNWTYPAAMEGKKDLEAIVVLTVKSNGSLMKTRFEKRSSSPMFDDSVIKAIERSDPLPPFPEGYKKSYDEIEINFNLKDLKGD